MAVIAAGRSQGGLTGRGPERHVAPIARDLGHEREIRHFAAPPAAAGAAGATGVAGARGRAGLAARIGHDRDMGDAIGRELVHHRDDLAVNGLGVAAHMHDAV